MSEVSRPLHVEASTLERIPDRSDFIVELARGRKTLHIGCCDWPLSENRATQPDFLHRRLTDAAEVCIGLDLSQEGIDALTEVGFENVRQGDAEQLTQLFGQSTFDVIVAGEVLEHLSNPGRFLEEAWSVLRDDGVLVLTVPNAFFLPRVVVGIAGVERVHHEHVAYYSPKTLTELVERFGFSVHRVGLTFPPGRTPFRRLLKLPFELAYQLRPIYGSTVVMVCGRPRTSRKHLILG